MSSINPLRYFVVTYSQEISMVSTCHDVATYSLILLIEVVDIAVQYFDKKLN